MSDLATLRAELAELGKAQTVRDGLIAEKRTERESLSLAAVRGDARAVKRLSVIAEEIDALQWSTQVGDNAIIALQREIDAAESAERDAHIAAILAERDAVLAALGEGNRQIAAATDTLAELIRENRKRAHYAAKLSDDAGEGHAGQSFVRREVRQVDGFITMRLAEIGVQGVERPLVGRLREDIMNTFGKKESASEGQA